jgi:ferrous iron transport protein B
MKLPFLIVLNMWDEAKSRGVEIRTQALSKSLGSPILKTVATRQIGLEKIHDHLQTHLPSSISITYLDAIEEGVSRITPLLPVAPISKRSLALMLLSGDESLAEWLHTNLSEGEILQIEKIRQEIQSRFAEPIGYLINQARLRKADELLSQVMEMKREAPKTLSTFLGNLAIHPLWGIPILLCVLWIIYEFVGVFGAQTSVNFLEKILFGKWLLPPIIHLLQRILPIPILQEFLVGPYGVFTMAITYAIAIVLPIVGYFFLIFGLMEDSGYLPRLAVMTNQIFKKMGLNGKAVLPRDVCRASCPLPLYLDLHDRRHLGYGWLSSCTGHPRREF